MCRTNIPAAWRPIIPALKRCAGACRRTIPTPCISRFISRRWSTANRWAKFPPDRADKGLPESAPGNYRYDEAGQLARGDQDRAAQESQGIICDRTIEHLGVSDQGVIMLRKLYKDSMDAIAAGKDPHRHD